MSWDLDGIKAALQDSGVAGVIGSIVSAYLTPAVKWTARFAILGVGAAFSFYALGPLLAWFGVTSTQGVSFAGFLAGFLGHNLLSKLKQYSDETSFPEIITNLMNIFRSNPK